MSLRPSPSSAATALPSPTVVPVLTASVIASASAAPTAPLPTPTLVAIAAGADLCPVELRGSDFGSEFDEYGELDFGDTGNPNPGWVAGREFAWYRGNEPEIEGIRGRIECYEMVASATAVYEQIAARDVGFIDGDGLEVEGYVVTLPVQLGDESLARFCPGYGPESEQPFYELSASARVGQATVYFLWQSLQELTPDTATIDAFSEFATAFLTKAAEHSSLSLASEPRSMPLEPVGRLDLRPAPPGTRTVFRGPVLEDDALQVAVLHRRAQVS